MEFCAGATGRATGNFRRGLGARDYGSTLEIVSGLTDGALVATIGSQILTDGQTVRIATSTTDSTGVKAIASAKGAK